MALGRSPPPQAPQHAGIRTVNMDERKAISVLLEMGTGQAPAKLLGPMVSCARIGYFSNHGALKVFGRPPHPR